MSDATKDEEGITVKVLSPDALIVVLKMTSEAAAAEGKADAFAHVLKMLDELRHVSEDELARNEHSPIAIAQVLTIKAIMQAVAPLPKMCQGRARTSLDRLAALFEQIGFDLPDDEEDEAA